MNIRFTILSDNHTERFGFLAEHGLSFYIESNESNILFDTGASNVFAKNAAKAQLELFGIDFIVLSHGHYDHVGGMKKALFEAPSSMLILHKESIEAKYRSMNGDKKYIGIPRSYKKAIEKVQLENRVKYVDAPYKLTRHIQVVPCGEVKYFPYDWPFYCESENGEMYYDDFGDEIALVYTGQDSNVVVVGCSHAGIIDILNRVITHTEKPVSYIVGGLHLKDADIGEVETVAEYLYKNSIATITGHCTGLSGYTALCSMIPHLIRPMYTGLQFQLEI